ncbi:signal peptidase I [Micromonospora citrea]|uniref:Signal peptidase I n=1 Tax=Micromonospora citrea TaxID=47855 RepID=A0A1C6VXX8_9ACTN|nr:S26 family signal peptidase [Micromonospora citrea]SCL71057.1 signal peptidase I [Micromonospora citrea]
MPEPTLLIAVGAVVTLGAAVLVARALLQVVGVNGDSMTPTYQEGDQLLVLRRGFRHRLRVGAVVVCLPPPGIRITAGDADAATQLMVKRVAALPAGEVYVLGDAPRHSLDSRAFGALPAELVRGVVIRRLRAASRHPGRQPGLASSPGGHDVAPRGQAG